MEVKCIPFLSPLLHSPYAIVFPYVLPSTYVTVFWHKIGAFMSFYLWLTFVIFYSFIFKGIIEPNRIGIVVSSISTWNSKLNSKSIEFCFFSSSLTRNENWVIQVCSIRLNSLLFCLIFVLEFELNLRFSYINN